MLKHEVGSLYKGSEVKEINVGEVYKEDITKYHKASRKKVYGSQEARFAIALDIAKNGQTDPVALYKKRGSDFVIDGRNRLWALNHLGIKKANFFYLPSNYTLKQLEEYVMNTRTRVNPTPSQLAVEAFWLSMESDYTQATAAEQVGVNIRNVEAASGIYALAPKTLQSIFNGKTYVKLNGKHTDSLRSILADLKLRLTQEEEKPDVEPGSIGLAQLYKIFNAQVSACNVTFSKSDIAYVMKDIASDVKEDAVKSEGEQKVIDMASGKIVDSK